MPHSDQEPSNDTNASPRKWLFRVVPIELRCIHCQRVFVNQRYYRRRTCSPECHSAYQAALRDGVPVKFSEENLAKFAETGRQFILKAMEAHKLGARSGPYETHHEAKIWHLISPEGVEHTVRNLNHFCRQHFGDEWRLYSNGINNHARWVRGVTTNGMVSHYKGWRVKIPAETPGEQRVSPGDSINPGT